ncbi:MAG: Holliday junction resolvase RuvX [Chthoniobacterales bacterium]
MSRYLGIDFGDARIGVAVSDEMNFMAHPLETIFVKQTPPIRRICSIITEKSVSKIIVGMPRNMDGSHGASAQKVRVFIDSLAAVTSCEIIPWDERMTTVSATRALREAGRNAKQQRDIVDQAAAQIILQSWMDGQPDGSALL